MWFADPQSEATPNPINHPPDKVLLFVDADVLVLKNMDSLFSTDFPGVKHVVVARDCCDMFNPVPTPHAICAQAATASPTPCARCWGRHRAPRVLQRASPSDLLPPMEECRGGNCCQVLMLPAIVFCKWAGAWLHHEGLSST